MFTLLFLLRMDKDGLDHILSKARASTRKGQPLGKIYALCNAYNATEKRVPGECTKY